MNILPPEEQDKLFLKCKKELLIAFSYPDNQFERASSVLAKAMRLSEESQLAKCSPSQDRPDICKDCPTFLEGCEGSNQEDCAHRDSPDREKIEGLIKKAIIDYNQDPNPEHAFDYYVPDIAKQISALFPDIEQVVAAKSIIFAQASEKAALSLKEQWQREAKREEHDHMTKRCVDEGNAAYKRGVKVEGERIIGEVENWLNAQEWITKIKGGS